MEKRYSTDSRTIEAGDWFVALKGERFDGHRFVSDVVARGAKGLVVSDRASVPSTLPTNVEVQIVDDTLKAYGDFAAAHRKQFSIPVIAITGSSGKTTIKELLGALLATRFQVLKNEGTENNLIGVPKTLLRLNSHHQVVVAEMGTNQPGEIARLSQIVSPDMAILTQIGLSHLERLKSREGVKAEKLALLPHLKKGGVLFLNAEDAILVTVQSPDHECVRVYAPQNIRYDTSGMKFNLDGREFETKLLGRHNALNCAMAIAVAKRMGVDDKQIAQGLAAFEPAYGRMNVKNLGDIVVIDDSYNANPQSFAAAMEVLAGMPKRGRKIVICGDMLELGDGSESLHRAAAHTVIAAQPDLVIAAGKNMAFLAQEAVQNSFDPARMVLVKDNQEAGRVAREQIHSGDLVLVKGSRGMAMEKVLDFLTDKQVSSKG